MPVDESTTPSPTVLASDAMNPSVPLQSLRSRFEGKKFSRADGELSQLEWSERLQDALALNDLDLYVLDPVLPCPDGTLEPRAHANWKHDDRLALALLRSALAQSEHYELITKEGAKGCYDDLIKRTRRQGRVKQIVLFLEAVSIHCSPSEPLTPTARRVMDLVDRAFAIGPVTEDILGCFIVLNSLKDPAFESLRQTIFTAIANATESESLRDTSMQTIRVFDAEIKAGGKHRCST